MKTLLLTFSKHQWGTYLRNSVGLRFAGVLKDYKGNVSDCLRFRENLLSRDKSVVKILCAMSVYANRPHEFV